MGQEAIQIATTLGKYFEGFRSKPYICPAGTWTIGYGSTRVDGIRVTKDTQPISEEKAAELLEMDMGRSFVAAITLSPILIQSDERLGAITDFIYNLGRGAYQASTLRRRINEGDFLSARHEICRWVWGGGKRLPGLVLRRKLEASLL